MLGLTVSNGVVPIIPTDYSIANINGLFGSYSLKFVRFLLLWQLWPGVFTIFFFITEDIYIHIHKIDSFSIIDVHWIRNYFQTWWFFQVLPSSEFTLLNESLFHTVATDFASFTISWVYMCSTILVSFLVHIFLNIL